jgi:flagellar motor switch protein FliN
MSMSFAALGLLQNIDVRLTVELGGTDMRLRDVCALAEGQVVMLDRLVDEPLDLLVNGKVIARGEVVAEGNRFGLRIIEMVGDESEPEADRRAPPITVETAAPGSAQ